MLPKKGTVILSAKIQLRKCPVIPDTNYLLKLNFTSGYKDSNSWKFLACVFFNSYFSWSGSHFQGLGLQWGLNSHLFHFCVGGTHLTKIFGSTPSPTPWGLNSCLKLVTLCSVVEHVWKLGMNVAMRSSKVTTCLFHKHMCITRMWQREGNHTLPSKLI